MAAGSHTGQGTRTIFIQRQLDRRRQHSRQFENLTEKKFQPEGKTDGQKPKISSPEGYPSTAENA